MFYDTRKNDHGLPHNPFKAIVARLNAAKPTLPDATFTIVVRSTCFWRRRA
jgi:hypothetical protein